MRRDGGSSSRRGSFDDLDMVETVVKVKPVSKVTKGGRDRRFIALVVVGDRKGRIGVGQGKAREVSEAIRKGTQVAQRVMERVTIGSTIPHEIVGRCGAARVFLRPASPGTGVIAGSAVRAVIEAAGVQNVLSKSLGSDNIHNIAMATWDALRNLRNLRTVYSQRRLPVPQRTDEGETAVAEEIDHSPEDTVTVYELGSNLSTTSLKREVTPKDDVVPAPEADVEPGEKEADDQTVTETATAPAPEAATAEPAEEPEAPATAEQAPSEATADTDETEKDKGAEA